MTSMPTTSGKRIVLIIVALVLLWGVVLAVLVWRGARTPHYTRMRDAAGEAAGEGG